MPVARQISANVSHRRQNPRQDARILRTRQRIDAAFVRLLHLRPYGDIRVSDITKKARVGRATFYAHYAAKDDLLRSQFERIVAPMLLAKPETFGLLDSTHFFTHIGSAPDLYRALMGPHGGSAPRVLRACFETRIREVLTLGPAPGRGGCGLRDAAITRFVASSLVALGECWLEHGARETPRQMQALFTALIAPGVRACRLPTIAAK